MTTIVLPWPPSTLSPNGPHGHWAPHAKAKKAYRAECFVATKEQRAKLPSGERFDVALEFFAPDRRRYDRDNLVARCKAGLDGIADALNIDDSAFVRLSAEIVEHNGEACVRVTITEHRRGAK